MNRPSQPVRTVSALVGVVGALALAGCSAPAAPAASSGGADYLDGTYTAGGSYQTPESIEEIEVTVTLADGVITDVEVTGDPTRAESRDYQGRFIGGIADEVVGKRIDEISVSRVAGSSLTSGGFNQAIEEIKTEAAG